MKKFISYPAKQKSFLISICFSLVLIAFATPNSWAQKTWTGSSNTQWNNDLNWNPNGVPTSSDDVTISSASNNPVISTAATCKSLTIQASGTMTMTGGSLKVSGNWTNNGIFVPGTETVTFNGSWVTQTISGNTEFYNLTLDNANSTTNFGSSEITIAGKLRKNSGTMDPGTGTIIFTGSYGEITGDGAKYFYNLQINRGADIAHSDKNLTIYKDFTNNGIFNQDKSLTTFFRGDDVIHNLTGGGSTTFGNVNIEGTNTVNAGTHDFTVSESDFIITGTFNGDDSNVTLKGSSSISGLGSINFNNLTLLGTDKKTIAPSTEVTVNGNLITNDVLVINSDQTYSGSLIVNGNSSGKVTYKRWFKSDPLPANYSRWYISSAPVKVVSDFGTSNNGNGTNTSKIHKDENLYDFASYNEVTNDWNYVSAIPEELEPGKGYLISLNPGKDGIIQFTGELNNGNVNPNVTSTPEQGWNAIGNPYTSAIKIVGTGGFLAANTANLNPNFTAIYVWNEDAAYSGSEQFYRVIGSNGYIPTSGALTEVKPKTNNIQVGQGFIIHSNGTSPTVSFTKSMQVSDANLDLKSSEISWPGITLFAESKGQTRSTVVAFNEKMSDGLDVSYDCGLLASDDFQVYTHLADGSSSVDFAVQCLPDRQTNSLRIPIGVDLPDGGELVFKAAGIILPDGTNAVLEDQLAGTKTIFKNETDTYTVTLSGNTSGIGRFYLSFTGQALTNNESERTTNYTASFVNNQITISGAVEPGTKALLFDLAGRKLGEYPLEQSNRNEISVSGLTQTICILKIEGRNSSQAMKLIHIKN